MLDFERLEAELTADDFATALSIIDSIGRSGSNARLPNVSATMLFKAGVILGTLRARRELHQQRNIRG